MVLSILSMTTGHIPGSPKKQNSILHIFLSPAEHYLGLTLVDQSCLSFITHAMSVVFDSSWEFKTTSVCFSLI